MNAPRNTGRKLNGFERRFLALNEDEQYRMFRHLHILIVNEPDGRITVYGPKQDGTNRFSKHSATLVNAIEAHGPADEVKAETILYDALPLYLRELYCHGCIIGRAYPRTINPSELNQRLEFRQA